MLYYHLHCIECYPFLLNFLTETLMSTLNWNHMLQPKIGVAAFLPLKLMGAIKFNLNPQVDASRCMLQPWIGVAAFLPLELMGAIKFNLNPQVNARRCQIFGLFLLLFFFGVVDMSIHDSCISLADSWNN